MTPSIRRFSVALGAAALIATTRPTSLAAQSAASVAGHVADTAGKPMPAATVRLIGTQLGAFSDAVGNQRTGAFQVLFSTGGNFVVSDNDNAGFTAMVTVIQ